MAEETKPSPDAIRAAAAAAVAPDAETAQLLDKFSAGEKLSQAEYGKVGAFRARVQSLFGRGKGSGQTGPAARNAAALGAVAPAQTSADGLPVVPPDPGLVRRTTASLLQSADKIKVQWVENAAREAGADDRTLARARTSAALPTAHRELITELSPDILAELGIDPRRYPIYVALGVVGLHVTDLWLCVDELRRLKAERVTDRGSETPGTSQPVATTLKVGGDGAGVNFPVPMAKKTEK